ncbi:YggS family pyridoxal phosphate-dependent enzyme [Oceanibacterium hippocampi]|uniref:Pyridoxal phosphate homeostasis protein n=1 Tax=Oceanibacterium hippocampi TaxID=745714 RepID=A0A1Y5RLG1_9PROT|nr:YggS family pyridoxal phosphate-dependent enzyme [Oceanibacterium hippocampi]SLN20255.1 hypothetical protein OCH7691_00488 [Oceanibacterium hippocampi]
MTEPDPQSTVSPGAASATARLDHVRRRIEISARRWQRDPATVRLVAVSKTHDAEAIRPVLEAGHRLFGENRVQEAQAKWPALKDAFPDARLHLIGPLQTNKARDAVRLFDAIETVDRPKLARVLRDEMDREGRELPCFVQVNTGEETQKAGVVPAEADAFIRQCRDEYRLPVQGLMCIPPAEEDPAPHFAFLKVIAERNGLAELSMGMSGDYEIAVQFGATYVRVGTAIFGARPV